MHSQFMPQPLAVQALAVLALPVTPRYSAPVAVNPASGCGSPNNTKAHRRHRPVAGAFFVPAISIYGGCAQGAFERAGFLCVRSSTPAYSRHPSCGSDVGGSSHKGAVTMKHPHALNPSAIQQHAAALKARAFAALHADSSLSVRLARYNAAMARARALEAQGGVQ